MSSPNPDKSLAASAAAHRSWANTEDVAARLAPAHRAFEARFERQVDPDSRMRPEDRARCAEHAKRAYFREMAIRSNRARAARRAAAQTEPSDGAA